MRRRGFLGLGLGLATAPALVREAFGAGLALDPNDIARSWVRALDERKPLLVLVVPEGDDPGHNPWSRGQRFGAWLNYGGEEAHELLGLCVVACATPTALEQLGASADNDDLMVLVEGPDLPARVTRIRVELDPVLDDWEVPWEERQAIEEQKAKANNALITSALRRELAPDAATLRDRLARSHPDLLVARRSEIRTVLAAEGKATVVDAPIPGARWAHSGGCGMTFEDEGDRGWAVGCGMGHVPALSGRMLYFYTQEG